MLTVPEAARRIGRNPETVRRWIRAGKLRSTKAGTQHMIDERDLPSTRSSDLLPMPPQWSRTRRGDPLPEDILELLDAVREGR